MDLLVTILVVLAAWLSVALVAGVVIGRALARRPAPGLLASESLAAGADPLASFGPLDSRQRA
jgi:hypothetical protein